MRIVLFAGKGGVGKTSMAAATGVACAKRGLETLIMSLDAAHSLGDSFDLKRTLLDKNKGEPIPVAKNLFIQEVDVQEEMTKNWGDAIYKEWLPSSDYEEAFQCTIERYDEDRFKGWGDPDSEVEIWVPVKAKG